jgi:hypothetical protein
MKTPDIAEIRKRYDQCTEAESDSRDKAADDIRFVDVAGEMWDEAQRKKRGSRPCYEFNLLRQHVRQVTGDQRQSRPQIKVRATEESDIDGAELRQGLIHNIESESNANRAYDTAFDFAVKGGFGCWRVVTEYSRDDAWEQDIRIKEIRDPFAVWFDPSASEYDRRDARFAFYEQWMSREEFRARYPDAQETQWDATGKEDSWSREHDLRIAEYWVKKPVQRTLLLLSDGRTVGADETVAVLDDLAAQGITVVRERKVTAQKVWMYVVSGAEVLSGPHEWPGKYIPLVPVFGDLTRVDGRDSYNGLVRHAKDAARLNNYYMTAAMETIAKLPKNPYLVTPKMLEGQGVKTFWEKAATEDPLFLPYTPDPQAPGGRPLRENGPEFPAAMVNLAQVTNDLMKGVTGIHDASLGIRSNETSGRAIIARQREGDTANFVYIDNLSKSIQYTGEIISDLLPHIYDTARVVRVIGNDGIEKYQKVNAVIVDAATGRPQILNDLSAGKYDITVDTGPSFSTRRAEFVELMNTLFQSNPQAFTVFGDLFFKAMDAPQAQELAERAKLLLPPPLQQKLAQQDGKGDPAMLMQQMQQQMEEQKRAIEEEAAKVQNEKTEVDAQLARLEAKRQQMQAEFQASTAKLDAHAANMEAERLRRLLQIQSTEQINGTEYGIGGLG